MTSRIINVANSKSRNYEQLCTDDECVYTSCYCEENVWKMIENLYKNCKDLIDKSELYAVFISNDSRKVPIYNQKASKNDDPVVWDYHVITVHHDKKSKSTYVYDLDTRLDFPCLFETYVKFSFQNDEGFPLKYRRFFRVIPGDYYLKTFASNRSHMLVNGKEYSSPPPSYPPIQTKTSMNNIQEFISMKPIFQHGDIMNLNEFIKYFTKF